MPSYTIHINERGKDTVKLAGYGPTKRSARDALTRVAEQAFPDDQCRKDNEDAIVVTRGGAYVGTVSVERAD